MNKRFNSNNSAFDERFKEEESRAATSAERGFSDLNKQLRSMIDLQADEIARLRGIIERAENLPERRAVALSSSSYQDERFGRTDVTALASDGSAWLLAHATRPGYSGGWKRLPDLPQVADEMNGSQSRAADDGDE
ncbi:hypothetical protein [Acidocella aminolytica]|uniref:Uncharacterized protein n=1 Tax=Acidocella aminolytica 101 = DSM 11237 TaxID=1120923 RepID=A0A0D6PBH1_9PROT|nr:hypothetical protein [Acidocella aminolytica]GAN79022.1 hypothetical protein Aam_015_032 [Acidocella aminolytica 101 = DSM 11237]GBQ38446.1 hypothetical protein AA11237_1800 [Acidocella aminolytica 101 = DSM 11237]SHF37854.1 hypothetical protein SAMN02746095_03040 [Acidocella aminolytica 101 = DSM 11237]